MKKGKKGLKLLRFLNPFQELIEARRELKKLNEESEKLDHELEEIKEKKNKVLYLKH